MWDAVLFQERRIEKSTDEPMELSLTEIRKKLLACNKLVVGLDVAKVTEFCKSMYNFTTKLAAAQAKLKTVSDPVKAAFVSQGSTFEERHPALAHEVALVGARSMYYMCVYMALTFYRDSNTWAKGEKSEKARANLN